MLIISCNKRVYLLVASDVVVHCDCACCLWLMVGLDITLVQYTNSWLKYNAWYETVTMVGSSIVRWYTNKLYVDFMKESVIYVLLWSLIYVLDKLFVVTYFAFMFGTEIVWYYQYMVIWFWYCTYFFFGSTWHILMTTKRL